MSTWEQYFLLTAVFRSLVAAADATALDLRKSPDRQGETSNKESHILRASTGTERIESNFLKKTKN